MPRASARATARSKRAKEAVRARWKTATTVASSPPSAHEPAPNIVPQEEQPARRRVGGRRRGLKVHEGCIRAREVTFSQCDSCHVPTIQGTAYRSRQARHRYRCQRCFLQLSQSEQRFKWSKVHLPLVPRKRIFIEDKSEGAPISPDLFFSEGFELLVMSRAEFATGRTTSLSPASRRVVNVWSYGCGEAGEAVPDDERANRKRMLNKQPFTPIRWRRHQVEPFGCVAVSRPTAVLVKQAREGGEGGDDIWYRLVALYCTAPTAEAEELYHRKARRRASRYSPHMITLNIKSSESTCMDM